MLSLVLFSFFVGDTKIPCGDNPSYFTNVYYHMEFINCVLEGEDNECQCQKRQDKALGIVETPSPTLPPIQSLATSPVLLEKWILPILQLFFLMII